MVSHPPPQVNRDIEAVQDFDRNYFYFPFDKHKIRFTLSAPGFHITDCGSPALWGTSASQEPAFLSDMIPSTSGWLLERKVRCYDAAVLVSAS